MIRRIVCRPIKNLALANINLILVKLSEKFAARSVILQITTAHKMQNPNTRSESARAFCTKCDVFAFQIVCNVIKLKSIYIVYILFSYSYDSLWKGFISWARMNQSLNDEDATARAIYTCASFRIMRMVKEFLFKIVVICYTSFCVVIKVRDFVCVFVCISVLQIV